MNMAVVIPIALLISEVKSSACRLAYSSALAGGSLPASILIIATVPIISMSIPGLIPRNLTLSQLASLFNMSILHFLKM